MPIWAELLEAALRDESPDVLEGVSHSIVYHPDQATEYISAYRM